MLKNQILWRLGLLVGLILGASMVVTATASAAPFYTSCAETTGKESPYGNTACTEQESGPGGSYVHAYYSYLGTFLCLFADGVGEYEGSLCKDHLVGEQAHHGAYELVSASTPGPVVEGASTGWATLKGTVSGVSASVACATSKFTIQPEGSGKASGGAITSTQCTVNKPAKCTVHEPLTAEFEGQTEELSGKIVDKFTGSKSTNKTFVEIEFKNKGSEACSLSELKPFAAVGSQTCEFDAEIETIKEVQEVICNASGSNLKIGTEAATYSGIDRVMSSTKVKGGGHEQIGIQKTI
jgi:hypothetical protein